jgi:two-component system chemotaxis response regulator CheY
MERLNVMIVDDSMLAVQMLRIAFESLGHKVVRTASTGAEAITAYKICNPDVVTMDVTMPGMDGITATQKIMASHPDARIIVVSSQAQRKTVMDAVNAGAKGFLLKPINAERLLATLERVTGLKKAGEHSPDGTNGAAQSTAPLTGSANGAAPPSR